MIKFNEYVPVSVDGYELKGKEHILSHLTPEQFYTVQKDIEKCAEHLQASDSEIKDVDLDRLEIATLSRMAVIHLRAFFSDGRELDIQDFKYPSYYL